MFLLNLASVITAGSGPRNYDYDKKYERDKQGDELAENARIWNVYLDEAESYDMDMIGGFRNNIDGLLVFAALFSAVVTTFVAQTSQSLQPDNAQITASLLHETNQILRAAGNRTSINAIPTATLAPGSRTYSLTDLWVNGLFFTSLALSLSTALLTVLAKQWIQAYTVVVSGSAETRALIRHFRYAGLMKYKLSEVVESLPLILHSSVAIFFVGLALYVSQLSSPICGVVSAITVLTFVFYFGTSMLPAFDIACPYRIPFIFSFTKPLILFICAQFGHEEDIHNLVDQGMNLSLCNESKPGWTALHEAVFCGNLDTVTALSQQEPGLMSQASDYHFEKPRTALEVAIICCKPDVVACLLDHGAQAPPDALHTAVELHRLADESLKTVQLLFDHGWDRTVKNEYGNTPIDVVHDWPDWHQYKLQEPEFIDYLENYQTVRLSPYEPTAFPPLSEEKNQVGNVLEEIH
ncbi:hypothetical protein C0993_006880 [Termitomyces sp. T159_Od127]|nr:hypothetical protein C0993_006880 [Termitomyces sp. T159_Od127]